MFGKAQNTCLEVVVQVHSWFEQVNVRMQIFCSAKYLPTDAPKLWKPDLFPTTLQYTSIDFAYLVMNLQV